MNTRLFPLAALLAALITLGGCAAAKVSDHVAKGRAGETGNLGKTILVTRVDLPPENAGRMEKESGIASLAQTAVRSLPGVEMLPPDALMSGLQGREPLGASDSELAAAARAAGAETVIVLQVLGYGGELAIPFPPVYWLVTLDYAYHVRVIDARSGALYLDAHRGRRATRAYSMKGREALAESFLTDLRGLFGNAAATAASGS